MSTTDFLLPKVVRHYHNTNNKIFKKADKQHCLNSDKIKRARAL